MQSVDVGRGFDLIHVLNERYYPRLANALGTASSINPITKKIRKGTQEAVPPPASPPTAQERKATPIEAKPRRKKMAPKKLLKTSLKKLIRPPFMARLGC